MSQSLPVTFGQMIEANARHRADHPALVLRDKSLTHGELADLSHRLASGLARLGCRKQDRIAFLSHNSLEQCVIYGACELAGFIAASVNFRLVAEEVAYQINDSSARVFFFEESFTPLVDAIRSRIPSIVQFICIGITPDWAVDYESFLASGDPDGAPFRSASDDVAYLVYTSGTTGRPKGCMLAHQNHLWTTNSCSSDMGVHRMDRSLVVMPLFHVGGKIVLLSTQLRGATTVIVDKFDTSEYLRTLQDERISVGHLAPTMIQSLLEDPLSRSLDFSALRVVLYSAAAMPTAVLRRAIETFGRVFQQQYGLSESGATTLHRLEHDPDGDEWAQKRLRSVGIPFPGLELRIADDEGNALPDGTAGEILVRSPGTTVGYWNNSAATIDALRDGWLRTGDMGVLDEHGYLFLVDRKKDMIISGGENIYSREVEEVLFSHPAVLEAAVIGIPDEKWGEGVCAVIVTRPGFTTGPEDIVAHCREHLASYKKPRSVIFTDTLPKLASGKIDKISLRKQYG